MAYFANGSEGDAYETAYCARCRYQLDKDPDKGECCPVLMLHLLWNYDQDAEPDKKLALELFIPQHGTIPTQCTMFAAPDAGEAE